MQLHHRLESRRFGGVAALATAASAIAVGAFAIGAFAIGRISVGKLALGRGAAQRIAIDELAIGKLQVGSQSLGEADGITRLASHHSVDQTVEKLKDALRSKGITLFALIDHS